MADPIRCLSTNRDIGAYRVAYTALRAHYNKNPPKTGESVDTVMLRHMKEFGITQYPQIMRMVSYVRFEDMYLMNKHPTA